MILDVLRRLFGALFVFTALGVTMHLSGQASFLSETARSLTTSGKEAAAGSYMIASSIYVSTTQFVGMAMFFVLITICFAPRTYKVALSDKTE